MRSRVTGFFPAFFPLAAAALALLPWPRLTALLPTPHRLQDALTIFSGVVLEALPFVLLGVLVSALIRRYVSAERIQKIVPRHPVLAYPFVALCGFFLPVCECGNLPVARRLIRQGMRPSQAITFLLSAPIINPAVIISTIAAFRFLPELVAARFIVGFIIAITVGWVLRWMGDKNLVTEEGASCSHDHGGIRGIVDEFFEMMGTLALGAGIAALIQVFVPRSFLTDLGGTAVLAIGVMILLAFIVSLCSNVDAFFALSFAGTFPASSLLAFMVFGPMIDIRAISLMTRSFTPAAIATISLLVLQMTFLISLAAHYWGLL